MMQPDAKNRVIMIIAAALSVVFGFGIASGSAVFGLMTLLALAALALSWATGGLLAPLILSGTLIGYIVGNRGFAQVSVLGSVPLLPAEIALGSCVVLTLIQGASQRRWPVSKDLLSGSLLLWIALCSIRLAPDIKTYGAVAIRDFATVYYALFYFIALFLAEEPRARRLLLSGVGIGTVLLPFFFFASQLAPDAFLRFTFRGVPLILYKSDLASAFAAVGTVWAYARTYTTQGPARWIWRLSAIMNLALIGYTVGRATMLSVFIASLLLFLARERRFVVQVLVIGIVLATVSVSSTVIQGKSFTQTKVYSFYEHAASIADWKAEGSYEAALDSADNNRFRLVWWRQVLTDTWHHSPLLGEGWGFDLGEPFVRTYYGTRPDDFNVRSPHNILITLFGRTGLVGLLAFMLVVFAFGRRVLQVMRRYPRHTDLETLCLWMAAVIIFICACLGVVLEGPMGAIVFWVLLGVGNAGYLHARHDAAQADQEIAMGPSEPKPVAR